MNSRLICTQITGFAACLACSAEYSADDTSLGAVSQPLVVVEFGEPEERFQEDFVDEQGREWVFRRVIPESELATPVLEESIQPGDELPPDVSEDELLDELLAGKPIALKYVNGVYYEYEARHNLESLRAEFEKLQEAANGPEDPDKFVEEDAVEAESLLGHTVIGGTDNRFEIHDPTSGPHRAVAESFVTVTGRWCTAYMISSRVAITAAHCHWSTAGTVNVTSFNFGHDVNTSLAVANTFTVLAHPSTVSAASAGNVSNYWDIAIIEFPPNGGPTGVDIGTFTGWFGVDMVPPSSENWELFGYPQTVTPAGHQWGEQWGMSTFWNFGSTNSDPIHPDVSFPNWAIWYSLDTTNGNSGSPIFYRSGAQIRAISVHSKGLQAPGNKNSGARLGTQWVPYIDSVTSYTQTHSFGSNSGGI